jgi:hypothetical protein
MGINYIDSYIMDAKGKDVKRIHMVPEKGRGISLLGKALCV